MDNHFDYDLSHYSIKDIEEIFKLPGSYDMMMIENKERELNTRFANHNELSNEAKSKIIIFINECKNRLSNSEINPHLSLSSLVETYKKVYSMETELKPAVLQKQGGHYNIEHPNTSYGKSLPSEFYQGTINPLKKRILRSNLNIDTRFRENYYNSLSSNFSVTLPVQFNNIVSMQLSALEMPGTFYTISKVFKNHFFSISIPSLDTLIVTIPDGNYDYLSLQNYINSVLSAQTNLYNQLTFIADVNTPNGTNLGGSGRMVVGILSPTTPFLFILDFQADEFGNVDSNTPLPLKFGWLMGFRNGIYTNNTTYVSEGIIDLVGPKYMYLVVDDYNNNVNNLIIFYIILSFIVVKHSVLLLLLSLQ